MKNKVALIVTAVLLVALIIGASMLYNRLSAEQAPSALATQPARETVASGVPEKADVTQTESTASAETTHPEVSTVPDFTVYDADGNSHNLSDYFGKPIILNFWASWCGPCTGEMPAFQAAYEQYGEDIHFLIVNMTDGYQETVGRASGHITENGYTFPVFYDTQMDAADTYGVRTLPTTLFIDEEGYLVTYAMSAIPADILQVGIDMILE